MHACSTDILIGTETWLSVDIADSELMFPPNFVLFRRDRVGSRGGGVLIAVKQQFQPSLVEIESPLELIWISVRFCHVHCIIGVCYRPPDSRSDFIDVFSDATEQVMKKFPRCFLIIAGDFNYPGIDWKTLSITAQSNRAEHLGFLQCLHYHHLTQVVHEPTRGNHTLDLILTNNPALARVHILEEISDHRAIHCSITAPGFDKRKITKEILNYAQADTEKMNRMLQQFLVEFQSSFANRTTNENWCIFRDHLKQIEDSCVPRLAISSRVSDPWFTRDVKTCINRKKRAYRKASQSDKPDDWQKYKEISKQTEKTIIEAKK